MSLDLGKARVRSVFEEAFSKGRLEVIDEALAADARDRHPLEPGEPDFRTHLKGIVTMFRAAIPDLHASVEELVGENDTVAVRVRMTGTHTGAPLMGIQATGRPVDIEQFHFITVDGDGRGSMHNANVGIDDLLKQISPEKVAPAQR